MNASIQVGPIATAAPAGVLDRAASLRVADILTPPEMSRAVLQRLHDRVAIETRGVAVLNPDGSIPLYGIAADLARSSPRRPTTGERMKVYAEVAPPLAIDAGRRAVDSAGVTTDSITHLVTASCTGFGAPGVDLAIIEALDLPPSIQRTHIGFMGCHAAVNALRTAAAYARESVHHRVLVVCVEISTVHFHEDTRLDRVISNILFADGAAAVVVGATLDPMGPTLTGTSARLIPASRDAMGWEVGDHGFEMTLASDVPDRIARVLGTWVDETLAEHGLNRTEVGGWAIHPGGPRVIDAVGDALALPADATETSRAVLREHGNMSSATLLHILRRFAEEDHPRPWVGLAFGPGLAGELLLLQ